MVVNQLTWCQPSFPSIFLLPCNDTSMLLFMCFGSHVLMTLLLVGSILLAGWMDPQVIADACMHRPSPLKPDSESHISMTLPLAESLAGLQLPYCVMTCNAVVGQARV